ncbi:MAG: sugar ABC transporter permease [Aigarchaeota archaeon]|nr:sugar ABC transporter permease [Candidatus Wolframiiraptor gerlachensis]
MRRGVLPLILPALILLLMLTIYPTIYLYYMMFQSFNPLVDFAPRFAGLDNFMTFANDPEAWYAIGIMFLLTAITVPTQVGLGVLLAIIFTSRYLQGKILIRSLMLIPMSIPAVIVGLNWKMIFFTYGPLNAFLQSVGLLPQPWLSAPFGDPFNVIFVLAVLDIWQWTPFVMLAVASGIESVPADIREAASLDGATGLSLLRHIVLPMAKTVIMVIALLRLIDSLRIFDIIYMLTFGGPGNITTTLPFYIYKVGFTLTAAKANIGYAALLSVILLAMAITLVMMTLMRLFKVEKIIWG